jgi:predicted kinase
MVLNQSSCCALIVLIGLPGSGKSSLAQQLLQQHGNWRLISTDNIRSQLFGDAAIQGDWLKIWREVERQFRAAVCQIQNGEIAKTIYDATNAVRKQRGEAIALARATGFTHITGLWLDTPLELCLQRNQQRDRHVPESVILQMQRSLQDAPPSEGDGFDRLVRQLPDALELEDL